MDNKTEVWRRHPDIEKIEVSSFGRVRTVDRVVSCRENGTRLVKSRILKQHDINSKGYLYVGFCIDGKIVTKRVHRLVAQTFIPNPNNFPQVNHKDCDRGNNNVENLEFCTVSYNAKYREKFGISNTETKGQPVFAINLTTLEVSRFRSQSEAGRMLGVGQGHIGAVIRSERKQTGGFWFVNADDNSVDVTKHKLHEIDKTRLTAADTKSMDFVSQVISE